MADEVLKNDAVVDTPSVDVPTEPEAIELIVTRNTYVTPETFNEAQPFNGKQNQKEYSLVSEATEEEIYAKPTTSFNLDETELNLLVGEIHPLHATPEPLTANNPSLVWECGLDEDGNECCIVADDRLVAIKKTKGSVKVTAYDLVSNTSKEITVTIEDKNEEVKPQLDNSTTDSAAPSENKKG